LRFHFDLPWTTLFIRDPDGKIRFQYLHDNNANIAILHRDPAFASYLAVPGELPQGKWVIEFHGPTKPYTIEWLCGTGELPDEPEYRFAEERECWSETSGSSQDDGGFTLNRYPWNRRLQEGRRWYKGDFHSHTVFSDGKMTPVYRMRHAEEIGLDFFAATDHHVVSTLWPKSPVLVIPGVEITSSRGHFNALGLKRWLDWRIDAPDGGMESEQGMNRILRDAAAAGAIRSINHPMTKPWHWWFEETELDLIDTMEIWNDPTYPTNPEATEQTLRLWNALWNDGRRVIGIGGSDTHMLPTESYTENGPPSLIGDPGTYVLADGLSAEDILQAVRLGRVYVSRQPELEHSYRIGGVEYPPGSDLTQAVEASPDGTVTLKLSITKLEAGIIHMIENGDTVLTHPFQGASELEFAFCWKDAGYRWRRLEIRTSSGELLAFTNPVYQGKRSPQLKTWKQLLQAVNFTFDE
jgi:hypothetical protein